VTHALKTPIFQTPAAVGPARRPDHAESETIANHVVVAQERHAAEIAREILSSGGNAIDAAIALAGEIGVAFVLTTARPRAHDNPQLATLLIGNALPDSKIGRVDLGGRRPGPHRSGLAGRRGIRLFISQRRYVALRAVDHSGAGKSVSLLQWFAGRIEACGLASIDVTQ